MKQFVKIEHTVCNHLPIAEGFKSIMYFNFEQVKSFCLDEITDDTSPHYVLHINWPTESGHKETQQIDLTEKQLKKFKNICLIKGLTGIQEKE